MIKNIIWEIKKNKKYRKKIIKIFWFLFLFFLILLFISLQNKKKNNIEGEFYIPLREINENKDFEANVYFNDQIETSDFRNLIIDSINEAQDSIDISVYSINIGEIVLALEEAKNRNVQVNIILDQSKKDQHNIVFGKEYNFNISELGNCSDKTCIYMHHKFALFDKNTKNSKLLFGSFNYTDLQEKYDPSFILEVRDSDFIKAFQEEWDLISKLVNGYKKLRKNDYKPFNRKINYNNGFVEVWFSPGFKKNSIKQRMLNLIDEATENIDIMIWRLTDDDIADALYKKAQEGIEVRIITDDYYIWSNNSGIKRIVNKLENGSTIKNIEIVSDLYRTLNFKNIKYSSQDYFNPYLHHHTLIVDNDIVLSGTNNWSYNGFFKNDESIFVSNVDFLVEDFRDSFNYHYSKLRNKKLTIENRIEKISILNLNQDFINSKLLIYNEFSEKNEVPEKCFEIVVDKKDFSFNIPLECNKENSLLFIVDNNQEILASSYLNF